MNMIQRNCLVSPEFTGRVMISQQAADGPVQQVRGNRRQYLGAWRQLNHVPDGQAATVQHGFDLAELHAFLTNHSQLPGDPASNILSPVSQHVSLRRSAPRDTD
jgi:hypothetical protein